MSNFTRFNHKSLINLNVDDAGLIDDCNKGLARFCITEYHSKRFNKELNDIKFL